MAQARKRIISVIDTPYYHCIGRCVRRAFLCGSDAFSGRNYEHRRKWVVDKLQQLTQVFAIDVCSYAVMSNHYHVILKLSPDRVQHWTDKEIVERWQILFNGNEHTRAFLSSNLLTTENQLFLKAIVPIYRDRLSSISWFMRCLNESIARRANAEDDCTGRFWEGRFKSQALLDDAALLSCMAYVDLNPIRANMADSPEHSDYTSIQERIRLAIKPRELTWLLPMVSSEQDGGNLPIDLNSYISLVKWSCNQIIENKHETYSKTAQPILDLLGISLNTWNYSLSNFGKKYYCAVGSTRKIKILATRIGKRWLSGQGKNYQAKFS